MLRNLDEQVFKISIRFQVIGFCCFCNTVYKCAGFCLRNHINHAPIPLADAEHTDRLLGSVIVHRDFSFIKEHYSYSLLCKWFRAAVLPADKLLYAELYQTGDRKKCTECGAFFASSSNSVKYCPDCRKRITRRQAAERMRKRRAPVTQ